MKTETEIVSENEDIQDTIPTLFSLVVGTLRKLYMYMRRIHKQDSSMALDDFETDRGDIEVGSIPCLNANSPPGGYMHWSNYEPYEYDGEVPEMEVVYSIGDCDIEGSDKDTMMVLGPENGDRKKMIKSDTFVKKQDADT